MTNAITNFQPLLSYLQAACHCILDLLTPTPFLNIYHQLFLYDFVLHHERNTANSNKFIKFASALQMVDVCWVWEIQSINKRMLLNVCLILPLQNDLESFISKLAIIYMVFNQRERSFYPTNYSLCS